MRIGIIGSGMIGSTTARLFVNAGHEVAISNSRGPASLAALVAELGPRARAMTPVDAARWAEVVLLAVPWRKREALPPADALAGKIVIDAMNPYGENGTVMDLGASTSSEETRKRLPGARLVKAFNTAFAGTMSSGRVGSSKLVGLVAADDTEARKTVLRLAADLGFDAVDAGPLNSARYMEAMALMTIRLGFEQKMGTKIGFALVR